MISDQSARERALETSQSFIVQAPAGSGKTALLVYRLLKLLAIVDQPEQVLAITFTRKATSELRGRLMELLMLAESGARSEHEFEQFGVDLAAKVLVHSKAKNWQLLDTPQQLQIMTIDAFCSKLCGDMPWLSRLGDKPRTTEQADAHYAAAIEQLLSQLLGQPSKLTAALQMVLLELDFDYNRARRLFGSMLAKRDQWLRQLLQNDVTQLRSELENAWQEIAVEHQELLTSLLPEGMLVQLINIAYRASQFHQEDDSPLAVFRQSESVSSLGLEAWRGLLFILTTAGAKGFRKTVNVKCGFPPAEKKLKQEVLALLAELSQSAESDDLLPALQQLQILPKPRYGDDDWQQIIALEQVLKQLAAFLQLRFRATGECDHSEVAQRANLALAELEAPTDLALRMDYRLKHVLVDEFQDTSHSQLELLKKLTAGWQSDADQLAQTLFLVGDPMQSIYRFREADVSLFLQVADNSNTHVFANLDIEPLLLSENFRSGKTLVEWFNSTFTDSFPKHDKVLTGAIRYSSASTHKQGGQSPVMALCETAEQESEWVVEQIKRALPQLPDDKAQVAVLVRSRSHLKHLLPAIKRADIAFAGVDIQPLSETPAVVDVVSLCKAICRLDDRVSWLALLRGPWCGLTLAEIKVLLVRADISVWDQIQNSEISSHLNDESLTRLNQFCDVMRQALAQRQQVGLHSILRWCWFALGGNHTLMEAQREDIEMVFTLVESMQRGADMTSIVELDKALADLYAQAQQHADCRLVVSTIHKAKGMQYHTVILPGLAKQTMADQKDLLMWAEHSNRFGQERLLLAPIRLQQTPGSHFDYLRALEKQRSRNEAMRLMYVACTRAEQRLIMTGCIKYDPESETIRTPPASSLLASVWEATESSFEFSAVGQQADQDQINEQLSQQLSRIPAGFRADYPSSINWQAQQQLLSDDSITDQELLAADAIEFQWATEVATAVGIVLHNWLQHNSHKLYKVKVDDTLLNHWRAELATLRVPPTRKKWALDRLVQALLSMQADSQAGFLFEQYATQQNELALTSYERGAAKTYRIDRTFIDHQGTRWIVDYKTTTTKTKNLDAFVDIQVEKRHRTQLEKYGDLMHQLEPGPIKLAVYFPMLSKLRYWDYKIATD